MVDLVHWKAEDGHIRKYIGYAVAQEEPFFVDTMPSGDQGVPSHGDRGALEDDHKQDGYEPHNGNGAQDTGAPFHEPSGEDAEVHA